MAAALAAAEGVLGMWLAFELNVPPGAAIAVLAGAVFAGGRRRRAGPLAPPAGSRCAAAAALAALGLGAGGCIRHRVSGL